MDIFKLEHRKDNEDKIFFINHFWVPPQPRTCYGTRWYYLRVRIYFCLNIVPARADSIWVISPILFPLSFCHYPNIWKHPWTLTDCDSLALKSSLNISGKLIEISLKPIDHPLIDFEAMYWDEDGRLTTVSSFFSKMLKKSFNCNSDHNWKISKAFKI